MSDERRPDTRREAWPRAVSGARALLDSVRGLEADYPTTVELLRDALHRIEGTDAALVLLKLLDSDYTVALLDDLVQRSISDRFIMRVCEILGELSHDDAAHLVPPAVERRLEIEDDYVVYRAMAGLLGYLGLADALDALRQRALASGDPDTRDVFEDD